MRWVNSVFGKVHVGQFLLRRLMISAGSSFVNLETSVRRVFKSQITSLTTKCANQASLPRSYETVLRCVCLESHTSPKELSLSNWSQLPGSPCERATGVSLWGRCQWCLYDTGFKPKEDQKRKMLSSPWSALGWYLKSWILHCCLKYWFAFQVPVVL